MTEEIKNRLSNIGEAIGTIALEYIVGLEKENEKLQKNNKHIQDLIEAERQRQEECNNVHLRDIATLEKENKQLKEQIEKMKYCGNCFHNNKPSDKEFCWNCERQLDERPIIKDEWELAE